MSDKAERNGKFRVVDLLDESGCAIASLPPWRRRTSLLEQIYGIEPLDLRGQLIAEYGGLRGQAGSPNVVDCNRTIHQAARARKKTSCFEGAQGTLLESRPRHLYPYVTLLEPSPRGGLPAFGCRGRPDADRPRNRCGPRPNTTRVGEGPFPPNSKGKPHDHLCDTGTIRHPTGPSPLVAVGLMA